MKGKVIDVKKVADKFKELTIEEHDSKEIVKVTIDWDDKFYLGKLVTVDTHVVPIINANLDFIYPEGTIGN